MVVWFWVDGVARHEILRTPKKGAGALLVGANKIILRNAYVHPKYSLGSRRANHREKNRNKQDRCVGGFHQ